MAKSMSTSKSSGEKRLLDPKVMLEIGEKGLLEPEVMLEIGEKGLLEPKVMLEIEGKIYIKLCCLKGNHNSDYIVCYIMLIIYAQYK